MTETRLRLTKPEVYGVGAGLPAYYSLEGEEAGVVSRGYDAAGHFMVHRGSAEGNPFAWGQPLGIANDSLGNVGAGSWLWKEGVTSEQIKVWDVETGTVYSYAGPGSAWALSLPAYYSGYVYWWEVNVGADSRMRPAAWALRRATCDLATVSTVGSVDASPSPWGTHFEAGEWGSTMHYSMILNSTASILFGTFKGGPFSGPSSNLPCAARITLDGASATFSDTAANPFPLINHFLLPASDGSAVGVGGSVFFGNVGWLRQADSMAVSPVQRWPRDSDPWQFKETGETGGSDSMFCCWVSPDGTVGLATGVHGDPDSYQKLVRAPSLATGGSPTVVLYPLSLVNPGFAFAMVPADGGG